MLAAAAAFAAEARSEAPVTHAWPDGAAGVYRTQRGEAYAAFTLLAGVQQFPRFNATFSFFSAASFLGTQPHSPTATGVQPGGEIGFVFRDGTLPAWLGRRVRVGLYGSTFHAAGTSHESARFEAGSSFAMYGVDGRRFAALTTTVGGALVEDLKVVREGFQIGFKAESEFAIARDVKITPFVAVFGGHLSDSYTLIGGVVFDSGGVAPIALSERLRTREFGGHVGARMTWRFHRALALNFGGTAGPVWLRTRMHALNCFNSGATFAPECGPSNPTFRTTTATDSASATGFRGTATLGISAVLHPAVASLGGFMRFDTHIPGVENPQSADPGYFGALAPARVRYAGGFAYGGFVTLRIPLP